MSNNNRNVIKFPGSHVRDLPASNDSESLEPREVEQGAEVERSRFAKFMFGAGRFLRFIVYILMSWARGPIVGGCSIISVVTLACFAFAYFAFPEKSSMVWAFGSTSLISFFIAWSYDYILFKLSPIPMIATV